MARTLEQTTMRKIYVRLLPFAILTYFLCYLDRINVGFAALTMNKDLGLDAAVYGMAAGAFFWGYFLFEVPSNIILEKLGARLWIARIMVSWGIITALMAFIHTAREFYLVRFLVGAAEAGFFPAVIVYISHWFRTQDRAKAVAIFYAANPLSYVLGSPLAGLLLGISWFGLKAWRWLFILEGIPAIVFGVITVVYLTDWPREARWLPQDERDWIAGQLQEAVEARPRRVGGGNVNGIVAFAHVEGAAVHIHRLNSQRDQHVGVRVAVPVGVGREIVGIEEIANLEILRNRLAVVAGNSGSEVLRRFDAAGRGFDGQSRDGDGCARASGVGV